MILHTQRLVIACSALAVGCGGGVPADGMERGCGSVQCPSGLQVAVSGQLAEGSVIEARVRGELVGTVLLTEEIHDAGVAFFHGLVEPEVDIRLRMDGARYDWAFRPVYALTGAAGCAQCEVASVTLCLRSARRDAAVDPAS